MPNKPFDRNSKLKSLLGNGIFLSELAKIKREPDEEWGVLTITLFKKWGLVWEYYEAILHYLETDKMDYSKRDDDIRVVSYKTQKITPSEDPSNEFKTMTALQEPTGRNRGVFIRVPKEATRKGLIEFIQTHYKEISSALDDNYPDRITHQLPELQTKRKVGIYLMHREGMNMNDICLQYNCERRYVYAVVKEYEDKVNDR